MSVWSIVAALATIRNTDSALVGAGSFTELNLAVASGAPIIELTSPAITFDHQLTVRHAGAPLLIQSLIGTTLSGGQKTRLFLLQNGSMLSLRGVRLESGIADDCSECFPYGGAIFVSVGSKLQMHSVRLLDNRADNGGGAIYAASSIITVIDCTMTSNSASHEGGAVVALAESTVAATNCVMNSNSAHMGGAVYADGDLRALRQTTDGPNVTLSGCRITSNVCDWGGALFIGQAAVTTSDCAISFNGAREQVLSSV